MSDRSDEIFQRCRKFCPAKYFVQRKFCPKIKFYVLASFDGFNLISPGLFGPCILPVWGKIALPQCHKSNLANAWIMKLGRLVDQLKLSLLVYGLLP